jgi:hypothetical protein
MARPNYKSTLKGARRELQLLYQEREQLERKIARVRQSVVALTLLVEHSPDINTDVPRRLTEAVQLELQSDRNPLETPAIRTGIENQGFDIRSSNPLASIHSVLKRMIERGLVRVVFRRGPGGRGLLFYTRAFWWGDHGPPAGWVSPTPEEIAQERLKAEQEVSEMRKQAKAKSEAKAKARAENSRST